MQTIGSSKAPDAFRTISEVAEDLNIPQHVLRFWETKFTAIRPLKRAGGRRYYRPDDVDLLKGIRTLLYGKGYTIKGVQRILKEDGPRVIQQVGRDGIEPSAPPAGSALEPTEDPDDPPSWSEIATVPLPAAPVARDPSERVPTALSTPREWRPGTDGLRAALADLYECRRIIHATRAD
jgi:DNA-binding transcriptional MerR regulator